MLSRRPAKSPRSLQRLLGRGFGLLAIAAAASGATPVDAGANVAHRATSCTHSESGSTLVVTKPAGTVADDVLIATAVANDGSGNIGAPAGWTVLQANQTDAASWYRVAGASEPASYSFTKTTPDTFAVIISAFSGGDTAAPIAGSAQSSGTASSIALPNTTATRNGSMRWSSVGTSPSNNVPTSWDGGLTEACERAGNDAGLASAYEAQNAGATASRTATLGSSEPYWAYTAVVNAALPEISSISPTAGPTAGGQTVTITGQYFTGTTGVTFGGTAGTSVTVVNDTTITVVTPARAIGTVEVRVTAPPGTSVDAGTADNYTYQAPPTVTAISPSAGPTAGGTSVTITGTNFVSLSGAAAVRFGATNATSYVVDSATQITAVAPAGTGTQNVTVTTPGGTSTNTAADDYTYYAPPTVTALSPSAGPVAGGNSVVITGTNFGGLSGASAVQFGGTNATSYVVDSATQITAVAPAGTGTQDVRVTTPGGTSANTAADNYTYYAIPTITSIAPTTGPETGGTLITITGTNFAGLSGAAAVRFGATNASSYTVVNATTITATAPAETGTQDVRVTTPGGTTANTAADDYVYVPAPTITSLSPTAGPTAGATTVTITGTNFTGASQVQFGGTNATGYTVVNATTITATAPAGTGTVDVRVTTIGGTSANTAADNYTYYAPPTVTTLLPSSGPETGANTVTITGTNFAGLSGASAVQFGGVDATSYTVDSSTQITATAPAGTGNVSVRVTTPGGISANTASDDYTYVPAPTVTNLTPSAGPNGGGNTITITGTNFTGASQVMFGGSAAPGYTIVNATTITATAPAGTGTVNVRVTTVGGTSANTAADDYTYYAAPTITSISPMSGPAPGGTSVTITGTNFAGLSGTSAVQFGGVDATGYTVVNATTITATAPPGTGTVDVRVTTPGGTTPNTAADDFTYIPPPTISSITPTSGPATGGTVVTITGTSFTTATEVKFGTTDATSFTVVNGTTITATAPPHAAGTDDVRVTTPSGTSPNTAADDYTFVAAPTITGIAPSAGPNAGGTVVTITGTGFTGATQVQFGGVDATSYTVVNPTTITATAPAGTGTVNVRVTTVGGTSANTAADDYTYYAAPTITSISPMSGPAPGGTSVTITGTNFAGLSGTSAVQFGGVDATGYTVVNATTITATAPPGTGTVDVRVTTPGGTTPNTAADDFTYIPAPTIASIAPSSGPETGGTVVTITGTNLTTTTQVQFGGVDATSFTVVNGTTITATAPAGTGNVSVRVTSPSGTSANTAADDYAYVPAPSVTNVAPAAGPTAGGTSVTITGTNFTGATQVQFGGTNATGYTVVNATTITATAPAHAAGLVDVRVTTVGGTSADTAADDYTYFPAPTVSSIGPSSGPAAGGTTVTITGTGFTGTTQVQFGGVDATGYTVVNSTTITATAPPGTGTVDVRVTTPGGTSSNTAADNFTYIAAPTVSSITPTSGPAGGGTVVTITGTDFTTATEVKFGTTDATSFTVVNDTTITATSPAHAAGTDDIRVTTPSGTSPNTAADDFTFIAAPTVTAVSPSSGATAGGTAVTITGTGFTGTTQVQFGGTNATGYSVVNATTITATAPAHAAGTVAVRVTAPGGTSADTAADDYVYVDPPVVASISPSSGPAAGGTVVTITGSFLTGTTQVQFGGVDATSFTVVNATTITATAPAGSGVVNVRVTTPDGTSANVAADDFTYIPAPTITSLAPTQGPDSGGTTVTITGTDFTGATQVTFGGVNATGYTVVNATTITADTPTSAAGVVDVRVTTPGGVSANTAADDYEFLAACGLGSLGVTATDFSFTPFTLDGLDQIRSTTTNVQVDDMTGTGAGWKLEVGTTQFSAGGGKVLPTTAARISGATATPLGGNCTTPTNTVTPYPVPLPISPSKAKVFNADTGTGRGPVDVEFGVNLHVPANVESGTYTSTWTIDLTAGP